MSIFNSSGVLGSSTDIVNIVESATEEYSNVERLEEGVLNYTPSMVPVHARETADGTKYLVESDMLNKLSHYSGITMLEAFLAVCEANDISEENTYVAVEDPNESLGEMCCAEAVADIDMAINIDNKIQNKYDDLSSLKEAGINILFIDPISESAVNPEIKKSIKNACSGIDKSDSDSYNKAMAKALKTAFNDADSVADYKYVMRKCQSCKDCSPAIESLITKCQKKIEQRTEEDRANKAATKDYRRDQLAARKKEKQAERAARRANKAATAE